jgi:hypothetical protein
MKEYPSISHKIQLGLPIYAFNKLDGSNIRAEWNPKNGFYKFGSRNRLLGTDQPFLPESIYIIREKFEDSLHDIFKKQRYLSAVAFFEFYGKNSFAGHHVEEPHDVALIDISPSKKGIITPQEYTDIYGHLHIAPILYIGNANQPFVDSVRNSTLEGMTEEGVVCKAKHPKKGPVIMFKIKTFKWLQKLKDYCKDDEQLYQRLV